MSTVLRDGASEQSSEYRPFGTVQANGVKENGGAV